MKIAVLSSMKSHMDAIRQILLDGSSRQVLLFEGGMERLAAIADQEHPDLVILVGDISCGPGGLGLLEQATQRYPSMAFIMLCENASTECLICAMRLGVRDALHLPVDGPALLSAVTRIEQKLNMASTPRAPGKVIVFIACKGGSGATFLASNLGYVLAETEKAKVALLDLNLQFGDASLFVSDHVPTNTLADVTDNIDRLDASFLAASMVNVLPNYGVLAAPESTEQAVGIKPEHIDTLLKVAKANYDYVILDLGRQLNATSVKAMDHADMILAVLQETLPFIRDTKRLIHTMQMLDYPRDKIHLIINRYVKGGDIELRDVEMKVFKTIPNSYEAVSASVNLGVPIMKIAKHDPVTKALSEIAHHLVEGQQAKKGSWLTHIFHSA